MLGKGLESLIPPKKNQQNQNSQSQQSSHNFNSASAYSAYSVPQQNPQASSDSSYQSLQTNLAQVPETFLESNLRKDSEPVIPPVSLPAEAEPILPTEPAKILPEKIDLPNQPKQDQKKEGDRVQNRLINHPEDHLKPKEDAIFHIEIDKIRSNPHQPRQFFEEEGLRELAASIREFGVLQPILVSKVVTESDHGTDVQYELIAGERRLMASKMVGLRTIPAIIRRLTPEREKLEIAIIENIQRRNLDPIEEARAYTRLQDEFRLTQREIAAKLGKSREAIANSVRLLNLPTQMQQAVSAGKLSESQARLLLSIQDIAEQQKMFEDVLRNNLSVREIKARINKERDKKTNEIAFVPPETLALKERLEEFLGTKVDLKEEGDKGRITINFYSKEELRAILEKLFRD